MTVEIKILTLEDYPLFEFIAEDVFDDPIQWETTASFLKDGRHHLAAALDDSQIVGFATGLHYLHPDKPAPELWINEVGVAPTYQGQGIGKALLRCLLDHAASLGCREAWVLTDRTNIPAMRLYASLSASEPQQETIMFTFPLASLH